VGSDRPGEGCRLSDSARNILLIKSADNIVDVTDWRVSIINYLCNPSIKTDNSVRRATFKYVLVDDELYR
jgi:hypothetical protein